MEQQDRDDFAVKLTDQCSSHKEWLGVVRFGLKTLIDDPQLLIEIITREACKEVVRSPCKTYVPSDFARTIMDELGLRFVVTEKDLWSQKRR